MKKLVSGLLIVFSLASSHAEEFLPDYQLSLSQESKTATQLGATAVGLVVVGYAVFQLHPNIYNVSLETSVGFMSMGGGTTSGAGAVGYLFYAVSKGLTDNNLKEIKRDYSYLMRHVRVATRTGELSWHEGINQIYGKFVCFEMSQEQKIPYVSSLLMGLDKKAKELAAAGRDSMEDVLSEVEAFNFGWCSSDESKGAAVGILSGGVYFHTK